MAQETTQNKKGKQWYAWVIFGLSFLMIFVALGFGSSTKGTFLTAITGQLGLKRSQFTISDSLRYITTAIMSVMLGKFVERIGIRKMATFGFIFLTASFLLNAFAPQIVIALLCEKGSAFPVENLVFKPWVPAFLQNIAPYLIFYLGGILLGAGLAWTTTSMIGYLVEDWFSNGKGTIMGILLAANGLGGFASEFIVTKIVYGIDGSLSYAESHWQTAYIVIAIMFAVLGVLAVLLIRNKPEDIGTEPMWQDHKKKAKRQGLQWDGIAPEKVLRSPLFYISGICVLMTGFMLQSMTNVAKPFMYDIGLSKDYVIIIFASHSLIMMFAKTLTGIGYDTVGMRWTFLGCSLCALIAMTSLFLTGLFPEITALPWVYSIISSFGMPLETVIIPLLVSFLFGKRAYKKVLGYFLALNYAGQAIGVPLVNLAYDIQGTYQWIILALVGLVLIASVGQQIAMAISEKNRKKAEALKALEAAQIAKE